MLHRLDHQVSWEPRRIDADVPVIYQLMSICFESGRTDRSAHARILHLRSTGGRRLEPLGRGRDDGDRVWVVGSRFLALVCTRSRSRPCGDHGKRAGIDFVDNQAAITPLRSRRDLHGGFAPCSGCRCVPKAALDSGATLASADIGQNVDSVARFSDAAHGEHESFGSDFNFSWDSVDIN